MSSLVLTGPGLTATITRENGIAFDIVANTGGQVKPAAFGLRSLDPFFNTSAAAFLIDLSADVIAASVDMGDYAGDTDVLLLEAFSGQNGTGTQLASDSLTLTGGGSGFSFLTLSVSAATAPIRSLRMVGGSTVGPNSVFYDNLRLTTPTNAVVPEPATLISGLMAVALAAGVRARRRRAA